MPKAIDFPFRKAEVVIAIMGPIWGFTLALAMGLIYFETKNPLFAAASAWMAMINLFNLVPINPLDGGRIFKSIAFSIHSKVGFVFLALGIIACIAIVRYAKLGLFVFVLVIGSLDLLWEWRKSRQTKNIPDRDALGQFVSKQRNNLSKLGILGSAAAYLIIAAVLFGLMYSMNHVEGAKMAMKVLYG